MALSLRNVPLDIPSVAPTTPITGTQAVGFRLAKFAFWILVGYLAFQAFWVIYVSLEASSSIDKLLNTQINDANLQAKKDLITTLVNEKKEYREFVLKNAQMVLLNLLLPVITALLGYIFGSKEATSTSTTNES